MVDSKAASLTAVSRSNVVQSWRDGRVDGFIPRTGLKKFRLS